MSNHKQLYFPLGIGREGNKVREGVSERELWWWNVEGKRSCGWWRRREERVGIRSRQEAGRRGRRCEGELGHVEGEGRR